MRKGAAERTLRGIWRGAARVLPAAFVGAIASSRLPLAVVPAFSTAAPARFAVCELLGGGRLRRHTLRNSDWSFCIHHGSADASVVAEVFRQRYYRVPGEIERELAGRRRPVRVVDLGAHAGLFGIWIAQQLGEVEIVAFEPDPENFRALECTIRANAGKTTSWQAIEAAATAENGSVAFAPGASSSSRVAADGPYTAEARDVFPYLAHVDVLKVDIEGSEWALLHDPRFAGVSPAVLFLEYHRHLCPAGDPRTHALELLAAAGYEAEEVFAEPGVGLLRARRQ